jgi:hypothetical protein
MFDILWYLFLAAIAITAVVVAIKVAIALLPVALVIGGICVIGLIFCNDDCEKAPKNASTYAKNAQKHVENARFEVINYYDGIQRHYHEQIKSMTRQKPGVNFESVHPALDSAISVVVWAYCIATGDETFKPLITSANDYEGHSAQSAHYSGAAVDFRIKDIGNLATRKELASLIREELGERFTVLHESIGRANEHLHIQLRSGTYDRNVVWK